MKRILTACLTLIASGASAEGYGFRTPSANIYCNGSIDAGEIGCSIVVRHGPPAQPDPGGCSAVWGHHVQLDRTGPARVVCGPVPRKSSYSDVAPYGVTGDFGAIVCRSERSGLSCTNTTGNGFFLSRRRQEVY